MNKNTIVIMKIPTTLSWYLMLILIAINFNSIGQEIKTPPKTNPIKKVLFVGNSFTYFWNMPQLVHEMLKKNSFPLEVSQSTVGGSNLQEHWEKQKNTVTRELLQKNKWDFVILSDHSLSAINTPEEFEKYIKKFNELLKSEGAQPSLYMTWAYHSNPLMQKKITEKYNEIGKMLNISVVPVGEVIMTARRLRPDLNFYFDDKHQSPEGSYLIALVFYKALTGSSVLNIPERITSEDYRGQNLYLSIIQPETSLFLKQLVEEFDIPTLEKK
jgi:hypothetical protein